MANPDDYLDERDKRTRYETLAAALWTERASFDSHWRELGDYFMPRRTRFWSGDRNRGDKRNQNIIDSTARFSARTLSSGLHSGLTSPARPWLKLTTPDQSLAELPHVKVWLDLVTKRILTLFATTNLYNVLPLVYLDMGIFGTAAMSMVSDTKDLFRCYSYPIGSYALGMDERGLVATFVRRYEMTVRQIVKQFGVKEDGRTIDWSRISRTVKDCWARGDYETAVEVTWLVKPNDYQDRGRLESRYAMPFVSCYWEWSNDHQTFLRESGFETFPIMAPRWDITGEDTYGTDCPGMTALPDNKQLQIMQKRKGQAIEKQVNPPLSGPSSLRTQKTSLLPGDVTYVDVREGMQGLRPIHEVAINLADMTNDMAQVQYRIQRAFYEDLFLMLARSDEMRGTQPPTAREIDERHEEKLLALGPVLERTNDELLDPIVDRSYHLMEAAGLFPPPPQELQGVRLKVEYISILAQAQKLVGVVGQDRLLQTGAVLAQTFGPAVVDKFNVNRIIDNYGDMLGTDPQIIRSDEEADALGAQRARQQQMQAGAENAALAAKAAKDASQAPMTGDSVLNQVVAGAAQPGAAVPTGA
jgi:hypothetical protein